MRAKAVGSASNTKQAAQELIDRLPEDTTWEQLVYTLQVRHDIEAGLNDVKAGRVHTSDEIMASLGIDNR